MQEAIWAEYEMNKRIQGLFPMADKHLPLKHRTARSLELFRGDTWQFCVTVVDEFGDRVDITDASIIFTMRTDVKCDEDTETQVIQISSPSSQLVFANPTKGQFVLTILPSQTTDLELITYLFDIQMTKDSIVKTIIKRGISLLMDITR